MSYQINLKMMLMFVTIFLVSCAGSTETTDNNAFYYPVSDEEALPWLKYEKSNGSTSSYSSTKNYESDEFASYSTAEMRVGVQTSCREQASSHFKWPHTVKMNWIDGVTTTGTRATGIVVKIPATAENTLGMRINHVITCTLRYGSNTLTINID